MQRDISVGPVRTNVSCAANYDRAPHEEPQTFGYCWRIYFQGSSSTFSCVSFPSVFAFQDGMWDTQISALLSSPTVSLR